MEQLNKKELQLIFEALVSYYKIRRLDYFPYFEICEIRENLSNYDDKMNEIDNLIDKVENIIENLKKD